jgi:hypothetical protein
MTQLRSAKSDLISSNLRARGRFDFITHNNQDCHICDNPHFNSQGNLSLTTNSHHIAIMTSFIHGDLDLSTHGNHDQITPEIYGLIRKN